jgi:hypothetical protein
MRLLRSPRTVVHLVTLLEDMPVTETEEAIRHLAPTGIRVGTVIANMVKPNPLSDTRLKAAAKGTVTLQVPGFTDVMNKTLAEEFAVEAAQVLEQRRRRSVLETFGVPLAEVAFDPAGIDESALYTIAGQLSDQMAAVR